MQITTTKCRAFQHREFILEADESKVPESYLKNIVDEIEEMVASGSVFLPDQTFQIGWMTTLVQNYDSEKLTLYEPDLIHFPIKWVAGITNALRQMMLQLFSLDSVSLRGSMEIPSICQSLLVCDRYREPNFFMDRSASANANDSGWFIGCLDNSHDHNDSKNLKCTSVYDALLNQHGIESFASFPIGSMIANDPNDGLCIFKDGKRLEFLPDSYLSRMIEHKRD